MALQAVTSEAVLTIPGAYASYKVLTNPSGVATSGVLFLVGEADQGPAFSEEADLSQNFYGPDQISAIVAKYGSGRLVDAARIAAAPANDPDIVGSPQGFYLIKTNVSGKASKALANSYGTLYDKSYGEPGNLISFKIEDSPAEVPAQVTFTYAPHASAATILSARVNGGAVQSTASMAARRLPSEAVTAIDALTDIAATGGVSRNVLGGYADADTLSVAVAGNVVTITGNVAWSSTPQAGDTLIIPGAGSYTGVAQASCIAGGASQNLGVYVVNSATSTTIVATKLHDDTAMTLTAPVAVGAPTAISTEHTDILVYSQVTIKNTSNADADLAGVGKSLELYDGGGAADVALTFKTTAGAAVTWVSTVSTPALITSASERAVKLTEARQSSNYSQEIPAGGDIALQIGYLGTTASVTISGTQMTASVVGGAGAAFPTINLAQYKTIGDLAAFIGSHTGWSCSAGSNLIAQSPLWDVINKDLPTETKVHVLDLGTYTCGTTHGNKTGRIKRDARAFFKAMTEGSQLLQLGNPAAKANAGLPPVTALTFLSGGTRGASTNLSFTNAFTAMEKLRGNFVCPLVSRDATADITDGQTDSGSTYDIASVNAAAKTHVLKMSTVKARRNRQAFLSIAGTFTDQKAAANDIAAFRCAMAFEKFKFQGSDGSISWFQPWGAAVDAAAMQAAGFYKSILNKGANTSGVAGWDSSFDPNDDTQMEQALLNGLLPARRRETGGVAWVSDQTTYAVDSNFVFNSIQAVYAADLVSMTTQQRMERALVGQSLADVSAASAAALFAGIMADLKRLKLIAASDGAPAGFKNATFKLVGNTLYVSAQVYIANALAFVPISFLVSEIVQTATI